MWFVTAGQDWEDAWTPSVLDTVGVATLWTSGSIQHQRHGCKAARSGISKTNRAERKLSQQVVWNHWLTAGSSSTAAVQCDCSGPRLLFGNKISQGRGMMQKGVSSNGGGRWWWWLWRWLLIDACGLQAVRPSHPAVQEGIIHCVIFSH
jgi:hypothetical protein